MIQSALLISQLHIFVQLLKYRKKLETILSSGTKILIASHVGSEDDDGSTFISHGSKQGNHWSLLAINIENYYWDSLAWPVPTQPNQ